MAGRAGFFIDRLSSSGIGGEGRIAARNPVITLVIVFMPPAIWDVLDGGASVTLALAAAVLICPAIAYEAGPVGRAVEIRSYNLKPGTRAKITQDCTACHNVLAMEEAAPKILSDIGLDR